ncbi:MAG: DNA topoisomerase I, partial [Alphaproteobacteria bacterium]|nr:DNA topoisomerase I [Alphaproteobacteria bacterium]
RYVEYDFTADLEGELDDVSAGTRGYRDVLARFWRDFSAAVGETSELRIGEVLTTIDEVLAPHLYPPRADGGDPRACPSCGAGRLSLRTARSGSAFIGCSGYPECRFTRPLSPPSGDGAVGDERLLGHDDGQAVTLRAGRFGPYVQKGEASAEAPKPPRASLPKGWTPASVTLERALALLALPRLIGLHPEDGTPVEAGIGRFGPYVKHGAVYANIPDAEEVFTIGMNRAIEVLAQKAARGPRGGTSAAPLRDLGPHPEGGAVQVMAGRYGPYVKWGKVNATLPKDTAPEAIAFDEALALIAAKAGKGAGKGRTKAAGAAKPKAAPKSKVAAKPKAPAKAKAAAKPKTAAKPKAAAKPRKAGAAASDPLFED